jgi:carbon monoxide dehydrogenase subunit G
MATIRHHARIHADTDKVWALLADTGSIGDWFPGIDESSQEGDVRTIKMGPMEVKEQIVTNDDALRRLQYTVIDPPMGAHLATVDVIDDGEGCLLVYSCDVDDTMYELMNPMYASATDAIKQRAES